MAQDNDLAQLQSMIQAANGGWTAGVTSVSELPREQQLRKLGYRGGGPDPETLEQRQQNAAARAAAGQAGAAGAPAAYDWRNVGGSNYVIIEAVSSEGAHSTPLTIPPGCSISVEMIVQPTGASASAPSAEPSGTWEAQAMALENGSAPTLGPPEGPGHD